MKERDEHDNIQTREVDTRLFESGQLDDVIHVEKFGKRAHTSNQINVVFYLKFENINIISCNMKLYEINFMLHEIFKLKIDQSSTVTVARC